MRAEPLVSGPEPLPTGAAKRAADSTIETTKRYASLVQLEPQNVSSPVSASPNGVPLRAS